MPDKVRQVPKLPKPTELTSRSVWDVDDDQTIESQRLQQVALGSAEVKRVTLNECILMRVQGGDSKLLQPHLRDVVLDHCDLSNADWLQADWSRCQMINGRLTGFKANESKFADVLFKDCKADLAQFQQVTCKRVEFDHCDLHEAFFNEADVRGVIFRDCDLSGVDFSKAILKDVDLRGSTIEGIRLDPSRLHGVKVDLPQAIYIAQLLGLEIE
jgi:uncharacterized protein YjbI with pentapeptide repeats